MKRNGHVQLGAPFAPLRDAPPAAQFRHPGRDEPQAETVVDGAGVHPYPVVRDDELQPRMRPRRARFPRSGNEGGVGQLGRRFGQAAEADGHRAGVGMAPDVVQGLFGNAVDAHAHVVQEGVAARLVQLVQGRSYVEMHLESVLQGPQQRLDGGHQPHSKGGGMKAVARLPDVLFPNLVDQILCGVHQAVSFCRVGVQHLAGLPDMEPGGVKAGLGAAVKHFRDVPPQLLLLPAQQLLQFLALLVEAA